MTSSVAFELLAKNELMVSKLYKLFAERMPEHAEFWAALSIEEKGHAGMIHALETMVREGKLAIRPDRYDVSDIEKEVNGILEYIEYFRTSLVDFSSACKIALEVETGLLEGGFLRVFESDHPEMQRIFKSLRSMTETHYERLKSKCSM
jgi:rubrerythrin